MVNKKSSHCSDCDGISRREFLKGVGGTAILTAAAGSLPLFATPRPATAAAPTGRPETLVANLYQALTDEQKSKICFGWDHPKRLMIANNWHIVPQKIGEFYTPDQQAMIMAIFRAAHAEEWVEKRLKQVQDDDGGLRNYNVAIFGQPGTNQFQLVFTGRHLTLRVDGDSEPGVAFGGPIFYGHAADGFDEKPDHPGNVYWYQAVRANEVFRALDGKQRDQALVSGPVPPESPKTIRPRAKSERPGLPVEAMTRDQKELVEKVLQDLLAPMPQREKDEAIRYIRQHGGVESLHLAFYSHEDVGNDRVWDVWRLEGPSMVWYFRGAPHVHTWVYIGDGEAKTYVPG